MSLFSTFSKKAQFNDEVEQLRIQYSNEVSKLSDNQLKEKYFSINSMGLPGKERIIMYEVLKNEYQKRNLT